MRTKRFKTWLASVAVMLCVLFAIGAQAQVVEYEFSDITANGKNPSRTTGVISQATAAKPYYVVFGTRTAVGPNPADTTYVAIGDTLYAASNKVLTGTGGVLGSAAAIKTLAGADVVGACQYNQPADMFFKLSSTTAKKIVIYGKPNSANRALMGVRFAVVNSSAVQLNGSIPGALSTTSDAAYTQGYVLQKWDGTKVLSTTGPDMNTLNIAGDDIRGGRVVKNFGNGVRLTLEGVVSSTVSGSPAGINWTNSTACHEVMIEGFNAAKGQVLVLGALYNNNAYYIHKMIIVPSNVTVPITSVSILNDAATEKFVVGQTVQMVAKVDPIYGDYTWSIASGGAFASIDANGLLTCAAAGSVTVKAAGVNESNQPVEITKVITVEDLVPATALVINVPKAAGGLAVNSAYTVSATVAPANATYPAVKWDTLPGGTAKVAFATANGVTTIKATKAGSVRVKATNIYTSSVTADSLFTFVDRIATKVSITNKPTDSISMGDTLTLRTSIQPTDVSDKSLTWSSANTTMVSVSAAGKITAGTTVGSTMIRVVNTASGLKDSVLIKVRKAVKEVKKVTLNGGVTSLTVGQTAGTAFTIAVTPTDADLTYPPTFEIVQAGAGRASITTGGVVTAQAAGSVMVCATATDLRGGVKKAYANINILPAQSSDVAAGALTSEVLVIYENFGGVNPSENVGTAPTAWPAVYSDTGKYSGWAMVVGHNVSNLGAPQPGMPTPISPIVVDSIKKYKTGGIGVETQGSNWYQPVTLRNGYKAVDESDNATGSIKIQLSGIGSYPTFKSLQSYDTCSLPTWNSANRQDEVGYLFFGKQAKTNEWPELRFPADNGYLENLSRMEMIISGSRVNRYQVLMVRVQHLDNAGRVTSIDTMTYAVASTPRTISVPVSSDQVRIFMQARGDGNNSAIMDYNMDMGNTRIIAPYTHNRAATANGNPNILLHSLKVYAKVANKAGYTLTLNGGATATPAGPYAYGAKASVQAPAQNGSSANFVGWKISGRPDLSELSNPLKLEVTDNMNVTPVYAGDEVEVPVVNENFTNWPKYYEFDQNTDGRGPKNGLIRVPASGSGFSMAPNGTKVRVPLRYGYTQDSKDSVAITLQNCNVVPDRTVRAYNAPGAEKWTGYVLFGGLAANNKGYLDVDPLANITKVEMELSSYDNPTAFNRACAVLVNGDLKRNKMVQSIYAEPLTVETDALSQVNLRVGYGNQAQIEYSRLSTGVLDYTGSYIKTGLSAAHMAMHSLKMYAKVPAPDKRSYKLMREITGEGKILVSPVTETSDTAYMQGTVLSLRAIPGDKYSLESWEVNGQNMGANPNLTITMNEAKNVKANFAQGLVSYVKIIKDKQLTVTTSPEPDSVLNDSTYRFLVGADIAVTAVPTYGFKTNNNWLVDNAVKTGVQAGLQSVYTIDGTTLLNEGTISVKVTADSITDKVKLTVINKPIEGSLIFDHSPIDSTFKNDTLVVHFPKGVTIKGSLKAAYSYITKEGGVVLTGTSTTYSVDNMLMDNDRSISISWSRLKYIQLVLDNSDPNGEVEVNDPNSDYSNEERNMKYPKDYWVTLKILPNPGYMLSAVEGGASYMIEGDDVLKIQMDTATTTVIPEFAPKQAGVELLINENFQNATRWPQNAGTLGNVPSAIAYLGLASNWTPIGKSFSEILNTLKQYRVDNSLDGNKPDGPSSTKMQSGLVLTYDVKRELQIPVTGGGNITITTANYSHCNNCLIAKAVKGENIGKRYLGQVTPGMLALNKPAFANVSTSGSTTANSKRDSKAIGAQPFFDGDTTGAMIIDGMAYVEKLDIGYVSHTSNRCPAVYYNVTGEASIDDEGRFHGDVASMTLIKGSQIARPNDKPDNGKYGWGSSQEGMNMDQNMYVAENGVDQTQLVILPGFAKVGDYYDYTAIYLHDLKVWGSTTQITGIKDLLEKTQKNHLFYMLGNTNILKIDVPNAKTLVIYNDMGNVVKVFQEIGMETRDLSGFKAGTYFVHCYDEQGNRVSGAFVKLND